MFKPSADMLDAVWDSLIPADREALSDRWGRAFFTRIVDAALAEMDRHYRLSDDRHLVLLYDDGWVIQHPMACRPTLFTCPFNTEMTGRDFDDETPNGTYVGVLVPNLDGDKILTLTEVVSDGP